MTKFSKSLFNEEFDSKMEELSFIQQMSVSSGSDAYQPEWIPELIEYFFCHDQNEECIPNRLSCIVKLLSATSKFAYAEEYLAGKED